MPVVVSVIFFIIFHVLSISGEKLAKEGEMPAYQGMWLATLVLMPVGIFLTIKATSDSTLFDIDAYINPIKNFFIRKKGS
jgi:lipopolysaccharide export system permease protein